MSIPLSTIPSENAARTPIAVIAAIVAASAAASALICYLVYFHAPTDVAGTHLRSLPLLNAILNALSTYALIEGYRHIRARRIKFHRISMFAAFFFSSIFLVSYLVNFTLHGETHFNRLSAWWPFYWKLLASHIFLSVLGPADDSHHFFSLAHGPLSSSPSGSLATPSPSGSTSRSPE